MNSKNIKLLSTLLFIIFINSLFGQSTIDRKTKTKRINKLWKKYNYVSVNNKCNAAIVGEKILGGNDGGGRISIGISNIQIVSLLDKKLRPWKSPYSQAHTLIMNYKNDNGNIRIVDNSNKVGLLNACDNVILEPKYDDIGGFNEEGLAVASLGDKLDVINLAGKSVLKEPLKYSFNYQEHKRSVRNKTYPTVYSNNLIVSYDKVNYGVYNIIQDKEITPMKYSYIENTPFFENKFLYPLKQKKIGYKAYTNNKATIINFEGNEIVVPKMKDIIYHYTLDNKSYAFGKVIINSKESLNMIDTKTNQYVFSENLDIKKIKPINKGIWAVELNDNTKTKTGIFDINKQEFIIKPNENYTFDNGKITSHITSSVKNTANIILINPKNGNKELHHINTGKVVVTKPNSKFNLISLKDNGKTSEFILITNQPNRRSSITYSDLFDENLEIVFENAKINQYDIKNKKNMFYFEESINCYPCKKVYTAYNLNGKLIGEKQNYNPAK
tara:strand:+ start:159 stop:1655 length:1497 start_codon:yes stop_codon:yes gene_type:complete